MAMSKKHYQAIARAINYALYDDAERDGMLAWNQGILSVAAGIANVMQEDNPRFDRARFLEACETGRCKGMRQVKRLTPEQDGSAYNDEPGEALLPPCAVAMRRLCAGHARGLDAALPCDTRE